jgi:hypothetical protein
VPCAFDEHLHFVMKRMELPRRLLGYPPFCFILEVGGGGSGTAPPLLSVLCTAAEELLVRCGCGVRGLAPAEPCTMPNCCMCSLLL